jgi:hypothetical protein
MREGGEEFLKDLHKAEMHRLASGYFAVEDWLDEISTKMIELHSRVVSGR